MKSWHWLGLLVLGVVGCQLCSPSSNKQSAGQNAANSPAPIRPGVIPITPANTTITFTGSTALTSHTGSFEAFDGTFEMPTDDPKDMKIRVVVDMDSTTTKISLLTKHLKGEDFFDVPHNPKAEFVLNEIGGRSNDGAYQVSGKLTIHGVQKPVTFPAKIVVTPEEVSFSTTMTVVQSEFGMIEAAKKTKDEVPVTVAIRARRK